MTRFGLPHMHGRARFCRMHPGAAAAILLGLGGSIAQAQPVDPLGWQPDPSHSASYSRVTERHAAELAVHDYGAVFRALVEDLERSTVWTGAEPVHHKLRDALTELTMRFDRLDADLSRTSDPADAVTAFLADVPTGLFQEIDQGWFSGSRRVTYEDVEALPRPQATDFLHRQHAVQRLLVDFRRPARTQALEAIRLAADRWEEFVERGRSQYPWETWLNDHGPFRVASSIQHPPSRQWVIVHPELGVEVETAGRWLSSATASEALLLQVLGHVWYQWADASTPSAGLRWWGLSTAATLRDDLGPGFGLMAMYGPTITVGAMWHDEGTAGRWIDHPPRLLLGIDLYRLADRPRVSAQRRLDLRRSLVSALAGPTHR